VDCSVQGVDRVANLVRSKENGRNLGVRLATNKCQGEEVFRVVPVVPLSSTDDSAERVLVGAVDEFPVRRGHTRRSGFAIQPGDVGAAIAPG
jgi:hypothetical protein